MRRFRMSVLSACVLSAVLALLGCGGSSAVAPVAPVAPAPGVSVSSQAGARSLSFRIERLAGADRYAAAAAISREFQPGTSHWVVIASGELWSDGVAAGPVAAKLGAPVLFVTKYSVPKATAQELDRLRPSQILVLGGRATISDEVMVDLSAWTDEGAERLDGADRFAVAAKASAEVFTGTVETAEGCGCATSGQAVGWLWGIAGALVLARRRRPTMPHNTESPSSSHDTTARARWSRTGIPPR